MRNYYPAKGAHYTGEQAQRYGERLAFLAGLKGGELSRGDTLRDAEDEESALHDGFEWDDTVAGHEYRLIQAGQMLRFIVERVEVDGKEVEVRQFPLCMKKETEEGEEEEERVYILLERVAEEKPLRERLLAQARDEIVRWRKRYAVYKEVEAVVAAIDDYVGATA